MARLDHVAINVSDIAWYIDFFSRAFGMTVVDTDVKNDQIHQAWLDGGIQIIQTPTFSHASSSVLAHIAIKVDNLSDAITRVKLSGGTAMQKGENWFQLPGDVYLELLDGS